MAEDVLTGKIFLNEQRGCLTTTGSVSYCTFNFGSFYHVHKAAFGTLTVFNDEVLAEAAWMDLVVEENGYIVLLPVTGGLVYQDKDNVQYDVEIGQVFVTTVKAGDAFTVVNLHKNDAINFLQIRIAAVINKPVSVIKGFEFPELKNTMVALTPSVEIAGVLPFNMHIGRFDGRGEAVYKMKDPTRNFFCFVLAGAFEVQGRLMHIGDGLALWKIETVEIEALSNDAVLLMIEFRGSR